jgi:hypothetical protein
MVRPVRSTSTATNSESMSSSEDLESIPRRRWEFIYSDTKLTAGIVKPMLARARQAGRFLPTCSHQRHDESDLDQRDGQGQYQGSERFAHPLGDRLRMM